MSVPYEVIVDYAITRVKSMAKSAALGFAGMVLLLTGALVAFFNVLAVYDEKGVVMMSAVASGGIAICVLGILLLFMATNKKTQAENITRPSDLLGPQNNSPLEEAIAHLINEFVANKKEQQAEKQTATTGAI